MGDCGGEIKWSENEDVIQSAVLHKKPVAENKSGHSKFDARIDHTDHASFYCDDCKQEVIITELVLRKYNPEVIEGDEKLLCLHFELACTGCKKTDSKKMYINRSFGDICWK